MTSKIALEALIQVRDGRDFSSPKAILSRVTAEGACAQAEGCPYSLATYVEHCAFWQDIWLAKLRGEKGKSFIEDWRVPQPGEWHNVRKRFLRGLDEAIAIAEKTPFVHSMKDDDAACATLIQIAVHNAYHVGQFVFLKRMVKGLKADA